MKKNLLVILTCVLIALVVISCDDPKHEHSFSTDWKSNETQHWHECECGEKCDISEHEWDEGKITTPATADKKGVKTYTCKVCKATKTEEIADHDHKFSDWKDEENGKHYRICSVCNYKEEKEHNLNKGDVTRPATCKEKGEKTYTCSDCGYKKTEEIEKVDHKLDKLLKCEYCDKYVVSTYEELKTVFTTISEASITSPTILFKKGEYKLDANIKITKEGLSLEAEEGAKIIVSVSDSDKKALQLNADSITVTGFEFTYESDPTEINIIGGTGKNLKIKDNTFTGSYNMTGDDVSRGICLNAGVEGYEISGNTFKKLRQPAYLEGKGTVTNNTIEGTRGWVVCQNYVVEFTDNKFVGKNAEDIAIIAKNVTDAGNYSEEKCLEIAKANNNCRIDQQSLKFRIEDGKYISYPDDEASLKAAVEKGGDIRLKNDIDLNGTIYITKSITIDMAGHNISGRSTNANTEKKKLYIFSVETSDVTFELQNSSEKESVVNDKGNGYTRGISVAPKLNNIKTVIGKNVKINTAEGVCAFSGVLDVYGKIDVTKRELAIGGNGSLPYQADDPGVIINLYKGAEIKSTATVDGKTGRVAIFLPHKGIVNIKGAVVEGYAGILIRSGELNITDGAVIKGIANDTTLGDAPTGYGIRNDGSAVVVISNKNYYGNIKITITDATLESEYSTAIREANETSESEIDSLTINGNSILKSGSGVTSDLILKNKDKVNITGGTFSKNPSDYLKSGYKAEADGNNWKVVLSN